MINRSWAVAVVVLLLALGARPAPADIVWRGATWNDVYDSTALSLNASGNLVVNPDTTDIYGALIGEAHYSTSASFQALTAPWIDVTFVLPSTQVSAYLALEQPSDSAGGTASYIQFGAFNQNYDPPGWSGNSEVEADWWDEDSGNSWAENVGSLQTGANTLLVGRRADGTIDYWLDGTLVYSTTDITPQYFGDIYLGVAGGPVTFTDYQAGGGYDSAPEPGTLGTLLALGVSGLMFFRQRRKSG